MPNQLSGGVEVCRVKGCQNPATDFASVKIPNSALENYDLINPLRVPMCDGHLAVVRGAQALDGLSIKASGRFENGPDPGYCRHCTHHEWAHDPATGACPAERGPEWFVIVSRMYDDQELYGPFPNQERADHYGKHVLGLPSEMGADEEDFFTAMPVTAPRS